MRRGIFISCAIFFKAIVFLFDFQVKIIISLKLILINLKLQYKKTYYCISGNQLQFLKGQYYINDYECVNQR